MIKWLKIAILALLAGSLGAVLVYRYAPLSILEGTASQKFGNTTITTIQGSDTLSASRTTLNNNFSSLNTNKFELADWYATTSAPQLTTLGTITTGTWHGSTLTVPFGGTGSTTLSQYQVLLGNGTGNVTTPVGWGTSGQLLTSNGAGVLPSWGSPTVDTSLFYNWTAEHNFAYGLFATNASSTNATTTSLYVNGHRLSSNGGFGGTGVDGALSISSGTTTVALGTAGVYEKDYTSISITGTGSLNFSSAATSTSGVQVILRSQGACTFTSSSMTMIDLRWLGGGIGTGPAGTTDNQAGANYNGAGGSGGGSTAGAGSQGSVSGTGGSYSPGGSVLFPLATSTRFAPPGGNGGAGGGGSTGSTGTGGIGGGGLYIECNGGYNFTTGGFMANGATGSNGSGSPGGGSGGGGAGGNILVLYNSLTADTGTYSTSGASGGSGGGGNGGSGANGSHLEALNTYFY